MNIECEAKKNLQAVATIQVGSYTKFKEEKKVHVSKYNDLRYIFANIAVLQHQKCKNIINYRNKP